MTSSTPTIKAVTGGPVSDRKPEHGLSVLRRMEAQGLIRIACDALSETSQIAMRSTAASTASRARSRPLTCSACCWMPWPAWRPQITTCGCSMRSSTTGDGSRSGEPVPIR